MNQGVRAGRLGDGLLLHELAAATFHHACPPGVSAATAAAHVQRELSTDRFEQWLADPDHHIQVMTHDGAPVGYAVAVAGRPVAVTGELADTQLLEETTLWFLSKFYVLAQARGSGVAGELMDSVIQDATVNGSTGLWLTVNQLNPRANAFYERRGFRVVGTTTFPMGGQVHDDHVRLLRL
ncbi:GNAT family N-acetyltransferase [Kocuria sp.]|uniref:GNAT family N-acetyltransferase n=1 Tax=Kocuria sp. TaxID=1871328 RepID=UPI0026E03BD9|nr:GNAT family N-acetyltransferase [Kocuria sp.]MDO5619373.1 GNAT family N-acetyltransferase [Kocuria sp.]